MLLCKQLHDDGGVDGSVKEFNISMAQIFSSARLQGREFPDGCRLKVIATVYESATGKEEAVSNDDVMFVENPYNFHFSRSKSNFRPGFEYALKVWYGFLVLSLILHLINNVFVRTVDIYKT